MEKNCKPGQMKAPRLNEENSAAAEALSYELRKSGGLIRKDACLFVNRRKKNLRWRVPERELHYLNYKNIFLFLLCTGQMRMEQRGRNVWFLPA